MNVPRSRFQVRWTRTVFGTAFVGLLSPMLATAALILSPDGLTVYDTVNNVTWLADANLAAANRFGLPVCPAAGSHSCVNASGSMDYQSAVAWVQALNAAAFLGHTDWQLPTTPVYDAGCGKTGPNGDSFGFGCSASAYASLWNALGLTAPNTAVPIPANMVGAFADFQPYLYWSQTSQGGKGYSTFSFGNGSHGANTAPNFLYVLPMIAGKLPGTPAPVGDGLQVNPGGQTVYDPLANVTWLADADLAAMNTFGLPACESPTSPATCVAEDGAMSWTSASQFIANMNSGAGYLGQTNWQLPPIDPSCSGFDCTTGGKSPMAELFYSQLGLSKGQTIVAAPDVAVGPVHDLRPYLYWSCLGARIQDRCQADGPAPNFEWSFSFGSGFEGTDLLSNELYATVYFVGARGTGTLEWLPVVSHAAGLHDSEWRSDIGVLNPGSATANLRMTLYLSGAATTRTTYVPAGSQAILSDVVGQFGGTGSGALEMESDQSVIVTSRTYDQTGGGTFGQDYAASGVGSGLSVGQSAWLAQLTENSAYRTDISLTNTGTVAATVTVALFDAVGDPLANYAVTLAPGQWQQAVQPFRDEANQNGMVGGYAEVTVTAGSGVIATATVVDNLTNDPTTIEMTSDSGEVEWLPVVSHAAGLHGSEWRSDVGVLNPGSAAANLDVTLYTSSGTKTQTARVQAGTQTILADIVGQLGATRSGALEIRADRPVIVTSRTYDQTGSGTFGQDYASNGSGSGLSVGQSAWLPQLTENAAYRTDISLTNTGTAPADVEVDLFDGAGDPLATYTVALAPGEWQQAVQPFRNTAHQTSMDRGYAKVTVTAGSGVIATASVVDNLTNDPTTIKMHP